MKPDHLLVRILVCLVLGQITTAQSAASAGLRAGAATVEITPQELPVRVAGNLTETWADQVHDPLYVRCLVLNNGSNSLVLATVDSCVLDDALLDRAKILARRSTGIAVEQMLISATHTHSAPAVVGVHGTEPHLDYREHLIAQIAEAIAHAAAQLQPARLGWSLAHCPDFVFCRRWRMKSGAALNPKFTGQIRNVVRMNPGHNHPAMLYQTGPVDSAVTILAIQTKAGTPLALLANYSIHYAGAPGVSADYFGVFCRLIAEHLEPALSAPGFVALISNGTSGDANCIDFSQPRLDFDRFRVAEAVAAAALNAYRRIEFWDDAVLAGAIQLFEPPS